MPVYIVVAENYAKRAGRLEARWIGNVEANRGAGSAPFGRTLARESRFPTPLRVPKRDRRIRASLPTVNSPSRSSPSYLDYDR
jgi:hypothetical protein